MDNITMLAESAVIIDGIIYCVCKNMSLLFSIDTKNGEIELIGNLPKEKFFLNQCCRKIINYENKLVFIPYNAKYIHIYDVENRTWIEIDYPDSISEGYKYIEGAIYNNKIIMIGACAKNIIELDMTDYKVKIINTYFDKYEKFVDLFCRSGFSIINNCIYIALAVSNEVLIINLDNYEFEVKIVGNNGYSGITFDGEYFWLTPRRGEKVIKWDGNREIVKIELPFSQEENKCNYGGVYFIDNKIYLHGFEGRCSAVIDKEGNCTVDKNTYIFFEEVNHNSALGQTWDGKLIWFSLEKEQCYDCCIDRNKLDSYISKIVDFSVFAENDIIWEKSLYGLESFLNCISNS